VGVYRLMRGGGAGILKGGRYRMRMGGGLPAKFGQAAEERMDIMPSFHVGRYQ
jgi:hypothetical protein